MANAGAEGPVARRSSVKIMIGLAAIVIVALFASANFMVLDYSIRQANDFVATSEKTLVKNEFRQQIEQVVLYQSGMSVWDRGFDELADGSFSDDFIRRELRDWLWSDFGFSWTVFTKPGEETVLAVHNRHVVRPQEADQLLYWVSDLTKRAEAAYYAALSRTRDGWLLAKPAESGGVLSPTLAQINVTGMRMIDGTMSIIVVQSVVPKRLFIPDARKKPVLLVTVKPITAKMLVNSEQRLGIRDLGFLPITTEDSDLLLTGVGGDAFNPMAASWRPNRPGSFVWSMAMPQITALVAIFVVVMGFVALKFASTVRALERSEARNAYLACHDALTGLLNRSGFDDAMKKLLDKDTRPFAVFAVDLDQFKAVNDRHGHAAGDAVLRTIASRFLGRVAEKGVVARLGGDEFAVLLPGMTDRQALLDLANGLVRDAQIPIPFGGQLLAVGSSAGIAVYPDHGRTVHDLMVVADTALYTAKNGGRNRAVFASPEEDNAAKDIGIVYPRHAIVGPGLAS
ncbi:diguanylate cyclase (GGDEF)-like protein [Mycoplana sp. BE70]|uniref:GGDEF domain-containing protein n=1 Tax=Mycoplana sp. BE70 TaxID=2817775 RepID=UPI00285C47F8|nr:GGDEF domain-containing protein [Mycoplana sp. BE70]MDR6759594.1 diguanylate cyclase (GGDEF)-like protein [Mycoplana sp. BE70]